MNRDERKAVLRRRIPRISQCARGRDLLRSGTRELMDADVPITSPTADAPQAVLAKQLQNIGLQVAANCRKVAIRKAVFTPAKRRTLVTFEEDQQAKRQKMENTQNNDAITLAYPRTRVVRSSSIPPPQPRDSSLKSQRLSHTKNPRLFSKVVLSPPCVGATPAQQARTNPVSATISACARTKTLAGVRREKKSTLRQPLRPLPLPLRPPLLPPDDAPTDNDLISSNAEEECSFQRSYCVAKERSWEEKGRREAMMHMILFFTITLVNIFYMHYSTHIRITVLQGGWSIFILMALSMFVGMDYVSVQLETWSHMCTVFGLALWLGGVSWVLVARQHSLCTRETDPEKMPMICYFVLLQHQMPPNIMAMYALGSQLILPYVPDIHNRVIWCLGVSTMHGLLAQWTAQEAQGNKQAAFGAWVTFAGSIGVLLASLARASSLEATAYVRHQAAHAQHQASFQQDRLIKKLLSKRLNSIHFRPVSASAN